MSDDPNELVTLAVFDATHEAYLFKVFMEASGIPTFIADGHLIGVNPLLSNAIGGVKVQVRRQDLADSQELYKGYCSDNK